MQLRYSNDQKIESFALADGEDRTLRWLGEPISGSRLHTRLTRWEIIPVLYDGPVMIGVKIDPSTRRERLFREC